MIGQHKRLLEHIASSQPVKYQKHSDDKVSEAHTRVASLTDEKLEFEQHFSGVSQKNAFSVSPGCDSMKVFERVLASSELHHVPKKDRDTSEAELGACCGSRDGSAGSDKYEGVVRGAGNPCSHIAKESTVKGHVEDTGHSFYRVNKASGGETLGVGQVTRVAEFSHMSGSAGSPRENSLYCSPPGSPSRDLTVQLFVDQPIGLIQAVQAPSTADNNMECDALHENVNSRRNRDSQSLPVLLSEKVIDLYVMDEQVQSKGGYDIVTSEGLWGNISETLGLGSDCGPGLKLIYFKYLRQLEREKDRALLVEREHDSDLVTDTLTDSEQFAESEPFHEKSRAEQPMNGRSPIFSRDDPLDVDHSEDEAEIPSFKRHSEPAKSLYRTGGYPLMGNCGFSEECQDFLGAFPSDHRRCFKGGIDQQHHGTVGSANKQKRELGAGVEGQGLEYDAASVERLKKSLADTLMWIKRIAVEPGNPQMGQGPEGTDQNEKWVGDCSSQARKFRALLWQRRDDVRWGDGHSHQAKQQISPPSIYYEDSVQKEQQLPERPRPARERAAHQLGSTSAQKPFNESVNFQRSSSPSFNQHPQWVGQTSHRLARQAHHSFNDERNPEEFLDRPRKRVPIGEDFQAHIPSFRPVDHCRSSVGASGTAGPSGDETQSSDGNDEEEESRWLGKQVWPPPGSHRFAFNKDHHYVGRSRTSFCSCQDPGSLNCVRLHVEIERDRLMQELGRAFYIWKFDQMGESVADEWTKHEQRTYQTQVKMNPPSQGKNFWDQLPEAFPGKETKELVSFYFNVFVLRRRAMQNRLVPQHVDSDDDETHYPESDSEDSDDYESGDDGDEEEDQNASEYEDEDETDREEDGPYGSDSSGKLLEDTGFGDMGGYSSKLDEAQAMPITVRTARLMNLGDVEHSYPDPQQEEEIDVRLRTAHMSAKWSHHQHDNDEKHFEDDHISMVGEDELREVKTWEASHWDDADHDDLGHDAVAKGISSNGEQIPERDPSTLYKKAVDGTNQHTSLVGACDGEVWGPTMDITPINKRDKLLSTKGMIQEFFGSETSGLNASS